MTPITFTSTTSLDHARYQTLLDADPHHPHVHLIDIPFRITSRWQDEGCLFGLWEKIGQALAWAVFQTPWRMLDFAVHPSERGSSLEQEVFTWGKDQMIGYAQRSGENFIGAVELFEDARGVEKTTANLEALGFSLQDWSTFRFEFDLRGSFPAPELPQGFTVRPSRGAAEAEAHARLVGDVFGRGWMTPAWRRRTLAHPDYCPEIDLVVEAPDHTLVGFCQCWLREETGQIEPLGVHPDYQGMGLGRALERAALAALQAQGASVLAVDHGSTNERAVALSKKTGFRQVNNALRYGMNIS